MKGDFALLGFSWWGVALCVAALAAAILSGISSSRHLSRKKRALLLALRVLAVLCAAAALLRPAIQSELTRIKRVPLAVVVDDSRSMSLGADPLSKFTQKWLEENRQPLIDLEKYYNVEFFGLNEINAPLPEGAGVGDGFFTKEKTPLAASLEGIARSRLDLSGVILLSDGRETEEGSGEVPQSPVPLYPVSLYGKTPKDVWIEKVDAPPVAFIRTPVEVRVTVEASGVEKGKNTLSLYEGMELITSAQVQVGEKPVEAKLSFSPIRTGKRAYRLELSPTAGESSSLNNFAHFTMGVVRDKTRVLLVAGTPTWDVKFLRDRLGEDPSVDLITFLILRTVKDLSTIPENELSLIPFPTQELFEKELHSFDAVIFVNFDYTPYVPQQYLSNIVKFVKEDGGGFVMLGGDRSFGLGGYEGTPLEKILPVDLGGALAGGKFRAGPFKPRLTREGEAHPIFNFSQSPEELREAVSSLPELSGQNWALRAAPGSMVLAENPQAKSEYGPQPLVAIGDFGRGRSLAILTDSLWRWKMPYAASGGPDSFYRDFWSRSLRWLMHDPDMELIRLSTPPKNLRAKGKTTFSARVLDSSYQPASGAEVVGKLFSGDGKALNLRLREVSPGEYSTGEVELPKSGIYRLEAEGRLGGALLGHDELAFPVGPESPEPLRVGMDLAYLEKLARLSGGSLLSGNEREFFAKLKEAGEKRIEVVGRKVEEPWATSFFLVAALLLFAFDWALRRLNE